MAKTKKASVHSRAAKRATSPGIDTDKSLKNVQVPADDSLNSRPSILAIHQGAGVTKKSKSGRKAILSKKAKARALKYQDRAEADMDKTEKKIEKSRGRARVVQDRSKDWVDHNKKLEILKAEALKAAELKLLREENEEWEDEAEELSAAADAGGEAVEGDAEMAGNAPNPVSDAAAAVPLPAVTEEEEIL